MRRTLLAAACALSMMIVVACDTTGVVVAGCVAWNELEKNVAPSIPTMSRDEFALFSRGFARLTGGTPARPTKTGLCRQKTIPSNADLVEGLVQEVLTELAPLSAKYAPKR